MNRTEPPKGTLDPQQPWYKGGGQNLSAAFWDRFKAKLTGGTDASGTSYFSMVKITSADADKIIANMKKDPRGYPQMDQGNPNALYDYQNWIVEEYLEGPFREEVNDKIEQAALNSKWKQLAEKRKKQREQEAKKEAAKSFVSSSSALRPGKKISVKTTRMTGIIPKRAIPTEVAEKISAAASEETTQSSESAAPKAVISSLGRLTLDLEYVNNNLDAIKDIIEEDYAEAKARNKKEIEEYRKKVANRDRRITKKDLGNDKRSLKEIIKPFVGGFFSGVGGAIRALASFNLLDAIINGDVGKIFQSLMGIGITFLPQIGMLIAGQVMKSLVKGLGKSFGRRMFGGPRGRAPRGPRGPRGRMPRMGGIGKFAAMATLGTAALSLGSAYMNSQRDGEETDRLDELEAQEKALAAGGYAAITDKDLERFQKLNEKFSESLDILMGKRSRGGTPGSSSSSGGNGTTTVTGTSAAGIQSGDPSAHSGAQRLSVEQLAEVYKSVGFNNEDSAMMAMLAMRESGGRTDADTSTSGLDPGKVNEWSLGISQINWQAHSSWLPSIGINSPEDLKNPTLNAKAAKYLFDARRASGQGGFEDWKGAAGDIYHNTNDAHRQRALEHLNSKGNESGGYTSSRMSNRSVANMSVPSRGVIVNMIPSDNDGIGGGIGGGNVSETSGDDYVNPENENDIIGKLYRTQMNIIDVG